MSLSDLVTFLIRLETSFYFSETLYVLGPGTSWVTLGIFLIFMTFSFYATYHVLHYLMTQTQKKYLDNYSLVTPTEKILEKHNLGLVKNVHVSICIM